MSLDYPLSENGVKFLGSRHKCNRMKGIIAHSKTPESALRHLRNEGHSYHTRRRALTCFINYLDTPEMINIPFTPLEIPYWECLSGVAPAPIGRWATWVDANEWKDDDSWVEFIPDDVVVIKE